MWSHARAPENTRIVAVTEPHQRRAEPTTHNLTQTSLIWKTAREVKTSDKLKKKKKGGVSAGLRIEHREPVDSSAASQSVSQSGAVVCGAFTAC